MIKTRCRLQTQSFPCIGVHFKQHFQVIFSQAKIKTHTKWCSVLLLSSFLILKEEPCLWDILISMIEEKWCPLKILSSVLIMMNKLEYYIGKMRIRAFPKYNIKCQVYSIFWLQNSTFQYQLVPNK